MSRLGWSTLFGQTARMARILWPLRPTLVVIAFVLLDVSARAQPSAVTSARPTTRPPAIVMLRAQLKKFDETQEQGLADEIGPPPGNCRVDVNYMEDDELGEGFTEFVVEVFNRAGWKVEVAPVAPLACAAPSLVIQFSPAAASAAAKLQVRLSWSEPTALTPIWVDDAHRCSLRVTVGPQ